MIELLATSAIVIRRASLSETAMSKANRGLAPALAAVLIGFAIGSAGADTCKSFNAETNEELDGRCTVSYPDEGEVIQIGKSLFVFVESGRQGQWSTGKLNGKPAARYEINRTAYSYATLDLTLFLDRSDD